MSIISDILDIPLRLKLRYNDAVVKLRGLPRYYPDNYDNPKSSLNVEEKEETFSFVKSEIKIVGKIELDTLYRQKTSKKKSENKIEQSSTVNEKGETRVIDNNSEQSLCVEKKDDTFSIIKPNIKLVGKIDLASLNQSTRPEKKSKRQLAKERKERAIQSGKKSKKQLAKERNERLSKEKNPN